MKLFGYFFSIFYVVLRPKSQLFQEKLSKKTKKEEKSPKSNPEGNAQKNPKSEEKFSFFFGKFLEVFSKLSENVFWTSWDHLVAQKDGF